MLVDFDSRLLPTAAGELIVAHDSIVVVAAEHSAAQTHPD